MKIEFKSRFDATKIIHTEEIPDDTESKFRIRVALELAVKSGVDLSDADLSRARLSYARLSDAILSRANLSGARLYGCKLVKEY